MAIAHNQIGYLAVRGGDAASAEKEFRNAVHASPAYTQAWINLAAALAMQSKISDALSLGDQAISLDEAAIASGGMAPTTFPGF